MSRHVRSGLGIRSLEGGVKNVKEAHYALPSLESKDKDCSRVRSSCRRSTVVISALIAAFVGGHLIKV